MRILAVFFLMLLFMPSKGQEFSRSLAIRPVAQAAWATAAYDWRGGPKPSFFHVSSQSPGQMGVDGVLGLLFDWRHSERLTLSTGFLKNSFGYGFNIEVPKYALRLGTPLETGAQVRAYVATVPLNAAYQIGTVQLLGKKEKDNHIIRFKILAHAGLTFNYYGRRQSLRHWEQIAYHSASGGLFPDPNKATDDYIALEATPTLVHRFNIGLEYGLGFQFFNKLRYNGFRLDLIYSQGLLLQQRILIEYEINQQYTGFIRMRTRGSWAGVRLSLPIRVKKWE